MENKINCLIILGMYRSGTSALAGCLKLLGVNFGENGSFENNDLILVHDILLRDLGCKWDMVGNLPRDWQESEAADRARQSIKSILGRNFSSNKIWAVKDPRICRLMPLWLPLLEEMGINPRLILNLRHPLETARSLAEKNEFDLRKGLLLWLAHYREAFSACLDNSNVVITYDQLLADPVSTLKFISESLDVDYPKPLQKTYLKILEFVRPEMKHQHSGQSQNKEELEFAHFIHFYDQIRRLFAEKATSLTAEAGKKPDVYQYNKELLPSVLQHLSSEDSVSNIQNSKREKAALASGRLFNDILSLIGDHERVQHNRHLERERRLLNSTKLGITLFAQVYFPQEQDVVFTEEKSKKILLAPVEWQEITILAPDPILVKNKGLRLKPLNTRGIVHISSVRLMNSATGEEVFKIEKTEEFEKLRVRGDGFSLPGQEGLALFVFNNDPQIIFPPIPDLPDCPLELRVWIKALTNQEEIKNLWIHELKAKEELKTNLSEAQEQLSTARARIQEEQKAKEELNTEKHRLETNLSEAQEQLSTARARIQEEQKSKEELNTEKHRLETNLSEAQEQLSTARARIQEEQKAKEELNTEKHRLESDLSEAQEQLSTARARIQEEQKAKEELNTEKHHIETKLSEAQEQLTTARARIQEEQKSKEELNTEKHRLETNLSEAQEQLSTARARIQEEQKAKEELNTEKHRLESDLSEAQEQLSTARARIQEEQKAKEELNTEKHHIETKLSEAQEQLTTARAQNRQEQERINQLNLENSRLSSNNHLYAGKNRQLKRWIDQLQNDFNALIRSMEVMLFKGKKPGAANHMEQIFASYKSMQKNERTESPLHPSWNFDQKIPLDRLMQQLEKDVSALSNSARWKTGNTVIRFVEFMLFRGRPRLALGHMQEIFNEFQTKKDQGQSISSWLMQEWMRKLESDFHDILASKRWQVGNSLVRGLEMLLLRKKKPMATDHMQKLFVQFSQGQYTQGDSNTLRDADFRTVGTEDADSPRPSQFGRKSQQVPSGSKLNILFVNKGRMSTNSGYHVQHYAEGISRQGAACMVAVPKMDDDDQHTNNAFQVCTYKEIEQNGLTFPDGRGPDIVHAWTPREKVRKFCFKLAAKYSFKTVIHLEDNEEYLTENAVGRPYAELAALSLRELDSLMPAQRFHPIRGWEWLKKAQGLTLIIDTLQRFNPNGLPSIILPAPVDERLFYPRPINYELRKRLNIPANHLVLSYTGNVRALKRQEALEMYKAVVLLNKQGCPTTLIRTGTNFVTLGKDEFWYQEFEKPLGWVSRHEVADVMAASDILVQPGWPGRFDDQRFPAKLPEYFAMGRPVILPRTNLGLKVEHGVEGYVLDKADGEGIARAVLEISKDKEMAGRLAAGGVVFGRSRLKRPAPQKMVDFYQGLKENR